MADLHWLKVNEHIIFKVAVLMYKCVTSTAPQYLSNLVMKTHYRPLDRVQMDYYQLVNATLHKLETPLFLQWDQGYGMNSLRA